MFIAHANCPKPALQVLVWLLISICLFSFRVPLVPHSRQASSSLLLDFWLEFPWPFFFF